MSSSGSGSRSRPASEPGRLRRAGWTLALLVAAAAAADAQPTSTFLFINQEQLLTGSAAGQEILAEEERQRDAMRSEARALDASFEAEERRLTEQRKTLAPEEFRKLSDAFDARVVTARREQDERATALAQEFDQRRRQFYGQVAPILVMLMDRYGAKAIFDESSVLLADQSLNITAAVIAEIDAHAGRGMPPADAPAQTPPAPDPSPPLGPDATRPETQDATPPPARPGGGRDDGGN